LNNLSFKGQDRYFHSFERQDRYFH